ncbi:MAG: hypothetical protein ACPL5I_10120 [Thermodesulfobacteriota bacterium]
MNFILPLLIFLLSFFVGPLCAQERIVGEGEHKGFIVNEGRQSLKIAAIKPGQTIQVFLTPHWLTEFSGRVQCRLEDEKGELLRSALSTMGESTKEEPLFLEWTSNSQPKPAAYFIHILGSGGAYGGEILGTYTLQIILWNQNDGNSGTDAPESFEKALLLPISEPGHYLFEENFISGTADLQDIFKILVKPNHTLTLQAFPAQWQGAGHKGNLRWEFLNKSLKLLKSGICAYNQVNPFTVKIFHPRVKGEPKPALFYFSVKIEGKLSSIYTIQAEVKEGR